MKILGISLGHDTNFCLAEDGQIIEVIEAERFFRQKHYKLHATDLSEGDKLSGFQYVNINELKTFLNKIKNKWGSEYDYVAVQNQKREEEYQNLKKLLQEEGIFYNEIKNFDHHYSHACSSFFTSPFDDALILSYDGAGNDGYTILYQGKGNKINRINSFDIKFGASYNNFGYMVGIKPDNSGTSSGKTMGLASYGKPIKEWIPFFEKHITTYNKKPRKQVEGLQSYGNIHTTNWDFIAGNCCSTEETLTPKDATSHSIAATGQHAWTNLVINMLTDYKHISRNLCVVGGCALNGTTNYKIQKLKLFENFHFIPNPSDCGLSMGAALAAFYEKTDKLFKGHNEEYLNPYLGEEAYDKDQLECLKLEYGNLTLNSDQAAKHVAELICQDKIVGVIRGRYEIGPRALGNRSILCNSQNKEMRDIVNHKVKHREWYRPFAPVCTLEDSDKFFTNEHELPYMSAICYTKEEHRDALPSVTHVDGSARLQTISSSQNKFLYDTLKEIEKINNYPICLNTSFNPKGEPILNYYEAGLRMLHSTELDYVLIENILFWKK